MPNSVNISIVAAPPVEDILNIPGVLKAEHLGGIRYRIQYADGQETLERIVETSVLRQWRLTEIAVEKMSLENIFSMLSR